KISRDVKIAALNPYEGGKLSLKEILACVGFSECTFYQVLRLWWTTGDVVKCERNPGCPCILHHDDLQYLLRLVQYSPHWFLNELLSLLCHNHFISVHYTTIHHELERAGMSTKNSR
ncbi:hypothetical protein B0H10DRAFT_1832844, partial [Mycena sp. CBHHK59/15]